MVVTQVVIVSQHPKVPWKELTTSSSKKEVSPLLVVVATYKKTISKNVELLETYVKLEDQKNTVRLEAQKKYSIIICMKIFEWKCDQLFQEFLNRGTIIRGKKSRCNTLIEDSWTNLFRAG